MSTTGFCGTAVGSTDQNSSVCTPGEVTVNVVGVRLTATRPLFVVVWSARACPVTVPAAPVAISRGTDGVTR
ncbi:hypothetical protein EKG83_21730 [Saccharothrix syringae]|uniref:Uncharacterized protein n=1 Tax=Saccharothrix syringae TaxID=103733 RepID=A0A5Q0H206_SACSY|nr:hypothetical protein [Saccharothrix syringae]QFZ19702.1 hypothetical protein EKG83_21730 [Saccharothrix syringae]